MKDHALVIGMNDSMKLEKLRFARQAVAEKVPGGRMVRRVGGVEFPFRWCPAGNFAMGGRTRWHDSEPVHWVTLTHGFWMLETPVTQKMWQVVMGDTPSQRTGDALPVESVCWHDCNDFCETLRRRGMSVQLPTEAQWEYACRAGSEAPFVGELDEMAWYAANSGGTIHAVGQKTPNAWGLHDMHGNVWEWCSDWKKAYDASSSVNPVGPKSGRTYVYRGGGWNSDAEGCQSTVRLGGTSSKRSDDLGFRVVLRNSKK